MPDRAAIVTDAATRLASDDASFVTGEVIAADGGWLVARHPLH